MNLKISFESSPQTIEFELFVENCVSRLKEIYPERLVLCSDCFVELEPNRICPVCGVSAVTNLPIVYVLGDGKSEDL